MSDFAESVRSVASNPPLHVIKQRNGVCLADAPSLFGRLASNVLFDAIECANTAYMRAQAFRRWEFVQQPVA
ncbi:hypothetical protein HDG32_005750 [Paraburkholderia sp. CI2]|nr:hypothetical protein [Paraburkholderia sp. CI2]